MMKITKEEFNEKYAKPNTIVNCKTVKLNNEFLKLVDEFGFKYYDGFSYTSINKWYNFKENTGYNLNTGGYDNTEWYKEQGYKIVEYKRENNMKVNVNNKTVDIDNVLEEVEKLLNSGIDVECKNIREKFYLNDRSYLLDEDFKDSYSMSMVDIYVEIIEEGLRIPTKNIDSDSNKVYLDTKIKSIKTGEYYYTQKRFLSKNSKESIFDLLGIDFMLQF